MGDTNNNQNDGNELDTSQITPDSQDNMDFNSADSINQSIENETERFTFEDSPYTQSYETEPDDSGRKPKPKVIAAFIIIAVLLAGSVFAFVNRGTLLNTFALMTKSPVEYYSTIEKQSVNKGIDTLTEYYDKSLTLYKEKKASGNAQDMDVKLTVNSQFTSLLGLTDFQSIQAKISSLSKNNSGKAAIGLSYNDQSLVTFNTFLNSETGELFTNIPELSSAYLMFSLDELMSYSGDIGYNYADYMKEIETLLNNDSLSPKTLNALLKKYSSLIIDNIDDMKLEKNVSISASDLKGTYNVLTSELNGEDDYNITAAILNEAKDDNDLKNLFVTLQICTEDEYSQLIEDAITDLNDSKESLTSSGDTLLMKVYVDKTGKIRGREFISGEGENASGTGYYLVTKDSKIGFTAWVKEDGVNIFEFTGDGNNSSDGFTGSTVFSYSEYSADYDDYTTYSFNIDAEKANIVNNKGYINGKYTISSSLFMGAELLFDCKADEQQQNIKFQLIYGGIDAATLDITSKEGTYEDFEFPSDSEEVYDGVNDIYSYMATADFEGLLARVEEVTGLDLENILNSLY